MVLINHYLFIVNDIISEDYIKFNSIWIRYSKANKTFTKINLNNSGRIIKVFNSPINIILIKILKSDNIPEDKYLFPDYNYKNGFEYYKDKSFYMAGYPKFSGKKVERCICSGKINEIDEFQFEHTLDSRSSSSGSPICLIDNKCIVGIHNFDSGDIVFNDMRLKDNPTHDHEVEIVKSIALPLSGWKFKIDPMSDGHKKKVFETAYDDSSWKNIRIAATWEEQGSKGYDGIAWYRIKFTMPPKSECSAVEIHFGAVDETAWVWLNGKYVGQHDVGIMGWDKPFDLNITDEINWGGENVLAVRVEDTVAAGGIWKPVVINLVK